MDKYTLSERDICTKFITPALRRAGWDEMLQIREEVSFTKGRIIVRGKLVTRGKAKRGLRTLFQAKHPVSFEAARFRAHRSDFAILLSGCRQVRFEGTTEGLNA
jgi:type I restriction enzyme R subunit